jgi:prepilin-type N-terminal cleavage/methylation domain-containing protein
MKKTGEKGFTLVEVLIVVAILSTVLTVATAAVVLMMRTTAQNDEWNVNLRQVQNAGDWMSHDALMAQEVHTDKSGVFLNLKWSDWDGNDFDVDYIIQNNMLMRRVNNGAPAMIAQYIVHDETPQSPTKCEWVDADNKLSVTIRASLRGARFAERTYEISPRPVATGG